MNDEKYAPDSVCLSGGAEGADEAWGEAAGDAGHRVIHYTFRGHKGWDKPNRTVLSQDELEVADHTLSMVNRVLKRSFPAHNTYVTNLLRRNFYQVYSSSSVYAIAGITGASVFGGTAWAVEAFKILHPSNLNIFVFDQDKSGWFKFASMYWELVDLPPIPAGRWTGIGTRDLKANGRKAIQDVFAQPKVS